MCQPNLYMFGLIYLTRYIGYIHILDVIHMCDISWYMARQTMICYGIVAICLSTCDRWPHRRLETFIIYLFIVYLSDGHWASSSNKMCNCYHQMGTIIYAGRGSQIHGKNISCFCKFLYPTPIIQHDIEIWTNSIDWYFSCTKTMFGSTYLKIQPPKYQMICP